MALSLSGNMPLCCKRASMLRHARSMPPTLFSVSVFPAMCGRYEVIFLLIYSRDCEAAHITPVFFKLQMFF